MNRPDDTVSQAFRDLLVEANARKRLEGRRLPDLERESCLIVAAWQIQPASLEKL